MSDQNVDLSLATELGYHQMGSIKVSVTSPKSTDNVTEPVDYNYSHTNFSSPPMKSSSAFDFEEQLQKQRPLQEITIKKSSSKTSPKSAPVDPKAFHRLEKQVNNMQKYVKTWIRREGRDRSLAAIRVQSVYRGWFDRKSVAGHRMARVMQASNARKGSVYFDAPNARRSVTRKGSVYFNSVDEGESHTEAHTVTIGVDEYSNLRAEVRASTEIAAVAKFHVTQVQDENRVLETKLTKMAAKFASLEEVVHLLLKEVAHLSEDNKNEKERVFSDQGSVLESSPPASPPPASPAPRGKGSDGRWMETLDPKTGLVYYFNEFTQETKWLPPDGAEDKVVTMEPGVLAAASKSPLAPKPRDSITPVSKPAWQRGAEGWEDDDDEEDGEDEEEDGPVTVAETPSLMSMRTPYAANSPIFSPQTGYGLKKEEEK